MLVHLIFRLLEHESCEKLYRQIVEQLNLRSFEDRASGKYAEISALIRLQMKQFGSEIHQLQSKLQESHSLYPLLYMSCRC